MKTWFFLPCLILLSVVGAQAQVVLPESGRLAGPLNTGVSEIGTEFFFAPEVWGTAPPGISPQSGWMEIQFGTRDGDRIPFSIEFQGIGPDIFVEFSGGQQFVYGDQEVETGSTVGLLNLETGLIEDLSVEVSFRNTGISRNSVVNRTGDVFRHSYPPAPNTFPDGLPPGFIHVEGRFSYDTLGQITGFEFSGSSAAFFGNLGLIPFFPRYSFGAFGEASLAIPVSCLPETPLEDCPDDRAARNGIPTPPFPFNDPDAVPTFIKPHTLMSSDELREVQVLPTVPDCSVHPRADAVGAAVGDRIYQIGGSYEGPELGRVDVYDGSTNTWEDGPRMLVPATEAQGVTIGDKIYVLGGRRFPRGPAINVLQVLDTETGSWTQLADLPFPITNAATVALGEQIFLFGGLTNRPNGSPAGNLRFSAFIQIYDAESDTWRVQDFELRREPIFITEASAITNGSDIYVLNGRMIDGEVTDGVWLYDTLTEGLRSTVPTLWGVYGASAARVGNRIYLAGGRSEVGGETETRLQIFEFEQGAWHRGLDQPISIASSATASASGRMYMIGGRSMTGINGFPGVDSGVVQYYDPGRGWQSCDSYPLTTSGDILSTASVLTGPAEMAPGAQITILGHHLAENSASAPPGFPVLTELSGVSATIDGKSAPMLRVSPERVDLQIPFDVDPSRGKVDVILSRDGQASPPTEIAIAEVAPHIFIQYCNSARQLAIQEDASSVSCLPEGSLNYPDNPVQPGESVRVQMTGLGAVDTPQELGQRAPEDPLVQALNLPTVMIEQMDGSFVEATVTSAFLAPGELGVYDVEIVVPADTFVSNRTYLTASAGGITSNRAGIAVGTPTTDNPLACMRDSNRAFRACSLLPDPNQLEPLRWGWMEEEAP